LLRKKGLIVTSKNSDFKIKFFRQKNQIPHENRHNEKLRQEYQMVSMVFFLIKGEKNIMTKKKQSSPCKQKKDRKKENLILKSNF
jgi:hypothetical protein